MSGTTQTSEAIELAVSSHEVVTADQIIIATNQQPQQQAQHVEHQQILTHQSAINVPAQVSAILPMQLHRVSTEGSVAIDGSEAPVAQETENGEEVYNETSVTEMGEIKDSKRKRSDKKKNKANKKRKRSHVDGENEEDSDTVHIEELSMNEDESDGEYNCCEYKGYVMGVTPKEFKKRVSAAVNEWSDSLNQEEEAMVAVPCPQEGCIEIVPEAEINVHCDSHVDDGTGIYKCPDKDCTYQNSKWTEMRGHLLSKHRGKFIVGNWKCSEEGCNQCFTRKLHLKRHMMFKHFYENLARSLAQQYKPPSVDDPEQRVKKLQPKPQSLRKFKKRSKLKKDKKNSKKYLRCIKCNAVFKNMEDVDSHMEKHLVRIKCTECEGYFDDEAQLKAHVKEHHSRMLHTNRCQLCSYSCLNSADLKTHMYSHENTVFECDLCGRVCANPKTLKSHRLRKHPGLFQNKGLVCIYCGMVFSNDVLLQDHIRNKHKMRLNGQRRINRREELKFPCNHCGFVANRQSSLQYHMRVHLENRPYKCTHCPYASKTRNNLILHIRTHKALAPLECPHCEFRGATNKVIQQHITSKHTNERPYKCTVCQWSTCYSGNLWKHMKMHKEKDGIEIPETARKRTPRVRKAQVGADMMMQQEQQQKPEMTSTSTTMEELPVSQVSIYEIHPAQQHQQHHQQQQQQLPQQQQQQQIHIQQQQGTHIIHQGHHEVIQMQPRVQVQTQQQAENSGIPQFAQVVLSEVPQHHQTVEIQIHGGEGGSMVIPRHGDDDMAAETVQQLVNLANMLPVSSSGHVMHTMQPAHAQ